MSRGQVFRVADVVEIVTEECCACGVLFGMTSYFRKERLDDHKGFYCPNGHSQSYFGETPAEKNARLLREEQARHARTIARANEADAQNRKLERKLKRVAKGVCPECKRTFNDLARHMACKHSGTPVVRIGAKPLP